MKKRLIILLGLTFLLYPNITHALGSSSISISTNKTKLVVGNTVTYTVTINATSKFSTWTYAMDCNSNLTWTGGSKVLETAGFSNSPITSKTFTFTYKATKSGTGTCTFKLNSLLDYNEEVEMGGTRKASKNVTIITQAQLEASYSKNNNLSSLSVTGYNLSPTFNKDTLEYNLELPYNVTNITVNAQKEDTTASINGTGNINLTTGLNKIKITVTAQNGSIKTYIINATVKELEPIDVTVNGIQLSVVRKKELLTPPNSTFEEKTITIDDKDVPAFYNDKTKTLLVGLKDNNGEISMYSYNETNKTYHLYQEYIFQSKILTIINDSTQIPKAYKETTAKINESTIKAYKLNESSTYFLIYAMNVETGQKNVYMYDETEKTIQKYNTEEITIINEQLENYKYIIIGLIAFLFITYLFILISLIKGHKKVIKEKKITYTSKNNNESINLTDSTTSIENETINQKKKKKKKS